MIVIDQKIGFMGGLDLGYGRLDSKQHFITDLSS
jgi:phosphatidylserine/phosphatidylglycerophosphate/cardiolipin synthase-like enzyme